MRKYFGIDLKFGDVVGGIHHSHIFYDENLSCMKTIQLMWMRVQDEKNCIDIPTAAQNPQSVTKADVKF